MRQTCERAGYRRLNFAGRQPPVFRKAVPSVFAFPLHLDCIVPIQKDIRLSGRTGEPDAVNLAWLAVSARLFCAGKTGGREPKSYLYMITFPLRPRPLHVSQSETCKMVSCQPPVFPFSFLPLSFTVRQTRCRSERGGRENWMRKTGLGRPSASSLPCGKLASGLQRRLNFGVRQSPVFRKTVLSVSAFSPSSPLLSADMKSEMLHGIEVHSNAVSRVSRIMLLDCLEHCFEGVSNYASKLPRIMLRRTVELCF